jgi:hypothetical protein
VLASALGELVSGGSLTSGNILMKTERSSLALIK